MTHPHRIMPAIMCSNFLILEQHLDPTVLVHDLFRSRNTSANRLHQAMAGVSRRGHTQTIHHRFLHSTLSHHRQAMRGTIPTIDMQLRSLTLHRVNTFPTRTTHHHSRPVNLLTTLLSQHQRHIVRHHHKLAKFQWLLTRPRRPRPHNPTLRPSRELTRRKRKRCLAESLSYHMTTNCSKSARNVQELYTVTTTQPILLSS